MLLDTLASTAGYPSATSVGKVINDPDPTTALIDPAASPAAKIRTACSAVTGDRRSDRTYPGGMITRQPLCPPNPNEFDTIGPGSQGRGAPATTSTKTPASASSN